MKKFKNILFVFTTESLPLDVMVKCINSATDGMVIIGESLGDSISVIGEGWERLHGKINNSLAPRKVGLIFLILVNHIVCKGWF